VDLVLLVLLGTSLLVGALAQPRLVDRTKPCHGRRGLILGVARVAIGCRGIGARVCRERRPGLYAIVEALFEVLLWSNVGVL
jgi:hypothetical protein